MHRPPALQGKATLVGVNWKFVDNEGNLGGSSAPSSARRTSGSGGMSDAAFPIVGLSGELPAGIDSESLRIIQRSRAARGLPIPLDPNAKAKEQAPARKLPSEQSTDELLSEIMSELDKIEGATAMMTAATAARSHQAPVVTRSVTQERRSAPAGADTPKPYDTPIGTRACACTCPHPTLIPASDM